MQNQNYENHYETLGIPETATAEEIKKAYRKLSLKYHPDKNLGNAESIIEFQKVSSAFEVLGDADKKRQYDMTRNNPFFKMASGVGGMDIPMNGMSMGVDELFSTLFNMGGANIGVNNPHRMGQTMDNTSSNPMEGIPAMFANMFAPGGNVRMFHNGIPVNVARGLNKPTPIIKTIKINMIDVLNGSTIPVELERWIVENGHKIFEKQTLYVDIPKGIDNNEIIILRDKGNINGDNCSGDVKLFVEVVNDTQFVREGLNLLYKKNLSLVDALCGVTFELKYINGKAYTINNQSGSVIKPNYRKIIPNMGLHRDNHSGNLIIEFNVEFPDKLTHEQITQLRSILSVEKVVSPNN